MKSAVTGCASKNDAATLTDKSFQFQLTTGGAFPSLTLNDILKNLVHAATFAAKIVVSRHLVF